ncbi:MAG: hypothetical protein AB7I38_18675 [Dehalococcoidia bacterium]
MTAERHPHHETGDFRSDEQRVEHERIDGLARDAHILAVTLTHHPETQEHEIALSSGEWPEVTRLLPGALRFLPGLSIEGIVKMRAANGYAHYAIEGSDAEGCLVLRRMESYP